MERNISYSIQSILFLLSMYVITLSINKIISIDLAAITYLLALIIIILNVLFISSRYIKIEKKILFLYFISLVLVSFNLLINQMGFTEILKIIGSQLFLLVGMLSNNDHIINNTKKRIYIIILVFIPISILLLELLNLIHHQFELSSIFVNKNNAILYFISLAPFLYYFNLKKTTLLIYILVMVVLFKTMGALIALIISITYIYKKINLKTLFYFISISLIILFIFIWLKNANYTSIDRIFNMIDIIYKLLTKYSLTQLSNLSYGDAFALTGSKDLSFLFRIKHWSDIINYYSDTQWIHQLIGIGIGNIQNVTKMQLVAHNDFLKLFVEFGPIYFFIYMILMVKILKEVIKYDKFVSIFFLTIFVYFGTENLMNNFLAMSFFYYYLGVFYTKARRERYENFNDK